MIRRIVGTIGFLLLFALGIKGQPGICGSPIMDNDCSSACCVCDLDGLVTESGHTVPGNSPPGYCTQVVHSIRYIAFVAGSVNLTFNVTVSSCTLGNAIELGVYESPDCSTFDLVSNCNTFMPVGQTFTFSNTKPLKVGCYYYIVIDGNGPAICTYSVNVISGSGKAPIVKIQNIDGPRKVCVGEMATYSMAGFTGACELEWKITNGTLLSSDNTMAQVLWSNAGKGTVCATARNICHEDSYCINVDIGDHSPPVNFSGKVCANALYDFNGQLYGAGNHEIKLKNNSGCDSTILLDVIEYPQIRNDVDTIICYPQCIKANNQQFCSSGRYTLLSKSKVSPFCDSTIELNLEVLKVVPKIYALNSFTCLNNRVKLFSDSSLVEGIGIVSYEWLDKNRKIIGTSDSILVDSAGRYFLIISLTTPSGKICAVETQIDLNNNFNNPDLQIQNPYPFCKNDSIDLSKLNIVDKYGSNPTYTYFRALPFNASNQINTTWLNVVDSSVYVLANSNGCLDTGIIQLKVKEEALISLKFPNYCEYSDVNRSDLEILGLNNVDSISEIYSCDPIQANCLVNFPFIITKDTIFYFTTNKLGCELTHQINLKTLSKPKLQASLSKLDYCENETVVLYLNQRKPNETIYFKSNLDTGIIVADSFIFKNVEIGNNEIRLFSEIRQCVDTAMVKFNIHQIESPPILNCFSTDSSVVFYWNSKNLIHPFSTQNTSAFVGTRLGRDSFYFGNLNSGDKVSMRFTLSDSICGDQIKDIECEAISCPPNMISINAPDTICLDLLNSIKIPLNAVISNPQTNYNARWFGKGIVDTLAGVFDPLLAGAGRHKIYFSYTKKSCQLIVEKDIIVRKIPDPKFLIDTLVCQDSNVLVRFLGIDSTADLHDWDFQGGSFMNIPNQKDYQLRWNVPGIKKLKLAIRNRSCMASNEHLTEVIPNAKIPELECETGDSSILFKWKNQNRIKKFDLIHPPGTIFQIQSDTSIYYQNLLPGAKVKLKVRALALFPCTDLETELECETKPCQPKDIFSDRRIIACLDQLGDTINLNSKLKEVPNQIIWKGKGVSSAGIFEPAIAESGTHCLTVDFISNLCHYHDSICYDLSLSPAPLWNVKNQYCFNDSVRGNIELVHLFHSNGPISYFINGNLQAPFSKLNNLSKGSYALELRDQLGCVYDTVIVINESNEINIDLGPDREIKRGDQILIIPTITGEFQQIHWSPSTNLSCDNCPNPLAKPTQTTLYQTEIIDSLGCIDIDNLEIRVSDYRVWAPNVFSPNGDGINEFFSIFGTVDVKEVSQLQIFDRWGELVFSKSNFPVNAANEGWDGRYKGDRVLPGVYIFIAEGILKNGERQKIQGEFTLIL